MPQDIPPKHVTRIFSTNKRQRNAQTHRFGYYATRKLNTHHHAYDLALAQRNNLGFTLNDQRAHEEAADET